MPLQGSGEDLDTHAWEAFQLGTSTISFLMGVRRREGLVHFKVSQVGHGAGLGFCVLGSYNFKTGTFCEKVTCSFEEGNLVRLGAWMLGYEPKTVTVGSDLHWNLKHGIRPE